jgi:endo-1,4-beta-xylanase
VPGPKSRGGTNIVVAVTLLIALVGYFSFDHLVLLGLSVWVCRYDYSDLGIVAFDVSGRELSSADFFRTWRPALIARDSDGAPSFGIQHGVSSILVALRRGEASSFDILWPAPGFGKVLLRADNSGRGYRPARDGSAVIELVPELANSRIGELRRWIDEHNGGRMASSAASDHLHSAEAMMREIQRERQPRVRAALAYRALSAALHSSEEEVLAEARDSIRRNRQVAMHVTLVDPAGLPLKNQLVHIRQRRGDFLFGVYYDTYDAETIRRMVSARLNYATLHLDWIRMEPRDGYFDFAHLDKKSAPRTLHELGFTVRGHAMVWFPDTSMPSWMAPKRGDGGAVRDALKQYIDAMVSHYGQQVQIWEVSNEGNAAWARWGLDNDAMTEVVRSAAAEVHRVAPESQTMINLALPLGEDVSLKYYPLIGQLSGGRINGFTDDPYRWAEWLLLAGVPYDLIGLQFYSGCWVNVTGGVQVPAIDLFRFATVLERYARLGKPIHISEISAPSSNRGDPGASFWHAPANRETQADYLEGVFTIAYGNPHVSAINWWDFYDEHAFAESGGLFDMDLSPKPSYLRLEELLTSWRYEGDLRTDALGIVSFNGPPGSYRFTSAVGGQSASSYIHLAGDDHSTAVTLLSTSSKPEKVLLSRAGTGTGNHPTRPRVLRNSVDPRH